MAQIALAAPGTVKAASAQVGSSGAFYGVLPAVGRLAEKVR